MTTATLEPEAPSISYRDMVRRSAAGKSLPPAAEIALVCSTWGQTLQHFNRDVERLKVRTKALHDLAAADKLAAEAAELGEKFGEAFRLQEPAEQKLEAKYVRDLHAIRAPAEALREQRDATDRRARSMREAAEDVLRQSIDPKIRTQAEERTAALEDERTRLLHEQREFGNEQSRRIEMQREHRQPAESIDATIRYGVEQNKRYSARVEEITAEIGRLQEWWRSDD